MKEIEVKILDIDPEKEAAKLVALGAKKDFEGPIIAHYLDTASDELWARGDVLRVRRRGDIIELTLKKKISGRSDIKMREEYEVQVSDFEAIKAIFAQLGFTLRSFKEDKYRISYKLDDTHVEIETVDGVPPYIEIEAPSTDRLEQVVRQLGYGMKDTVPWTAGEVRKYYEDKIKPE